MTDKEQSFMKLYVELQRLCNSGVCDMLSNSVECLNKCGEDVERKNDAIREVLRSIYYNKRTSEFAKTIGNNPDYLPKNFIQIAGDLALLNEQLLRLLKDFKEICPTTDKEGTFEDVIIENYTKDN